MAKPQKRGGKWRIRWTDHTGRVRSETYSDRQVANLALRRHELETEKARAGYSLGATGLRTFGELADYWIKYRVPEKRSGKKDISVIRRHLRPRFGDLRLRDVTVAQATRFKAEFQLSPKTLHNVLTLFIAMLNYAVDLGWLDSCPRIKKPTLVQTSYRYLRTRDEIRRFLEAALVEGQMAHALYCTAIYTGMRAGELAGLRWDCVDLERRSIQVARSYDGPTKAGYVRYPPILDPLLPVLTKLKAVRTGDFVFTNLNGSRLQPSARLFEEVLHRTLTRAGFPKPTEGRARHYIRFHDLRHTFASHWVMNGGDLYKLQQIGGWRSFAMVQRYAHLAPEAYAEDLDRLGTYEEPAKVLQLVEGAR